MRLLPELLDEPSGAFGRTHYDCIDHLCRGVVTLSRQRGRRPSRVEANVWKYYPLPQDMKVNVVT
jgi:hypothetical protein